MKVPAKYKTGYYPVITRCDDYKTKQELSMIKLYGFPISNYYNMVKMALLEKGMEFEEVIVKPSQEDIFLVKSPMGKVQCILWPS